MRVIIAAVGRLKAGPERELSVRYSERAAAGGRRIGWQGVAVVEVAESRSRRPQDRRLEEAVGLAAAVPEIAAIVALDATGEVLSSPQLAARLERWRDAETPAVAFLIGGADGLAESLLRRANLRLAFGTATWPHQLVRIMLLEQLYRAMTILSGHPYHRV
jgi:23S rRNA (pseudouridine1915-N3)-methyltransferase